MRLRLFVLAMLFMPVTPSAQTRDPLAGAWELTNRRNLMTGADEQMANPPMHLLFADGQYVQFTAASGRARLQTPRDQQTREQLLDQARMQGQYGTYSIAGNKVIQKIVNAANPILEGIELTSEFQLQGDVLILTRTNTGVEERFKRLQTT
jgi:hypothetical protein